MVTMCSDCVAISWFITFHVLVQVVLYETRWLPQMHESAKRPCEAFGADSLTRGHGRKPILYCNIMLCMNGSKWVKYLITWTKPQKSTKSTTLKHVHNMPMFRSTDLLTCPAIPCESILYSWYVLNMSWKYNWLQDDSDRFRWILMMLLWHVVSFMVTCFGALF